MTESTAWRPIPTEWRPKPPAARNIIGRKEGRFRVLEISVYFDYLSDEESQERNFEFVLRIPLTKENRKMSMTFWEFVASVKMEEVGIHVESRHWDEGIVGYRYTGRTNAWKPRYICISKLTKWCMPRSGNWGTLTRWKAERTKTVVRPRKLR